MKERIVELMKESMLQKDSTRTSVLRSIKAAFTNFEKEGKTLTEADEVKILMKLKSQREDAINQFKSANREDLVENEQKELDVLIEYIPKQPSEDEIKEYTQSIIDKMKSENGSISMKDMKSILSKVQEQYPTVNGKIVSECVKNNL